MLGARHALFAVTGVQTVTRVGQPSANKGLHVPAASGRNLALCRSTRDPSIDFLIW